MVRGNDSGTIAGNFVYPGVYSASSSPSPDSKTQQNITTSLNDSNQRSEDMIKATQLSFIEFPNNLNSSFDTDHPADITALSYILVSLMKAKSENQLDEKTDQLLRLLNSGPPSVETALADSAPLRMTGAIENAAQVPIFLNLLNSGSRAKRQASPALFAGLPQLPSVPQLQDGTRRDAAAEETLKQKVLGMMLQSMYSAQERLWPLESIVNKYQNLTPYRMAFIFLKLDQLVYETHALYLYLQRTIDSSNMTTTRQVQLYSQVMRRNIDVSYMVDYISERVPADQVVRLRQYLIRQEQEQLLKTKKEWDRTTTGYMERPDSYYNKAITQR